MVLVITMVALLLFIAISRRVTRDRAGNLESLL